MNDVVKLHQQLSELHQENDVLHQENGVLRDQLSDQRAKLEQRDVFINALKEKLRLMQAKQFGSSSEKASATQAELFNEAEADAEPEQLALDEETITVPSHQRKKKPRVSIPDDLPREEIIYDLPEADKTCGCGHTREVMGSEDHEQLDIIPAQVKVIRHRRLKYACPCCERAPVTAQKPNQAIEKSIASPGLLAFVATQKYCDALPLYRQSEIFKRSDIHISRTNLANWMMQCGALIQPLIDHLQAQLQQYAVVQMDETTVQVLDEPGKPAQSKSYMWLLAQFDTNPIVLYHYAASRSQNTPLSLLTERTQALMVDGYSGYNAACQQYNIQRLGCFAHARRKFIEVQKASPKGASKKTGKADQALSFIQRLYRIEQQIKDDPPDKRYTARQAQAVPVLHKLRAWLDKSLLHVVPSSALGKALVYLDNQWDYLSAYVDDGGYPIDNNAAERAIRPFAIGRKNWLFAKSQSGAKASANLYSLIETAKANGVEPYAYLRQVFTRLPNMTTKDDLGELMPWNCKNL